MAGSEGVVREADCTAPEGGEGTTEARGDGGRVVCHRAGGDGEEHRKIRKGDQTQPVALSCEVSASMAAAGEGVCECCGHVDGPT